MKKRLWLIFFALAFLALWLMPGTVRAADHSGTLATDETWGPADNPHNVIGNITVPAGITLTILPGAEVFFQGYYNMAVAGDMIAEGTSSDPILFTRSSDSLSYWTELRFYTSGSGSFAYCTIEYAYNGVNLNTNGACTIDHCTIRYCHNAGLYYYQTVVDPGHVITNNTIRKNRLYGAYIVNVTSALVGSGNVISNNQYGLCFINCTGPRVATGNTITRNLQYGVHFGNCSQPDLDSNVSESGLGVSYENCMDIGTIDDLTFTGNAGSAIQVKNSGLFTLGGNNTITDNGWPLAVDVGAFPDSSSQIPTSGNLRNAVQVVAGTGNRVGMWPKFSGLDYVMTGTNTIQSSGDLTLSPGIAVRCLSGTYIRIDGALNAVGTAEDPILFTRHGADSWSGLQFYGGSTGSIQHVCIEHSYHGLYEYQTASVPVSDSLFRHNTHGIYVHVGASVQVTGCRFDYNDYGIYIAAGGTATVGGSGDQLCCFKGNRDYAVQNLNAFTITAENNYWGDPSGPNHASHNLGRGDAVSDNVNFTPFAGACLSYENCISEICTSEIWASSSDTGDGDLTYLWEALDGGTVVGSDDHVAFDPPDVGPHPCPYRVRVTITSGETGLSTEQTFGIYVKLAGDANGSGRVDILDKRLVRDAYGSTPGSPNWDPRADVNCSGRVDILDKRVVRDQYGEADCACP